MSLSGDFKGPASATDNQKSATLTLDGKTYEFPVYQGSVGPDVIDISSLYKDTGCFTFDPGFTSTAFPSTRNRTCAA